MLGLVGFQGSVGSFKVQLGCLRFDSIVKV